MCGNFGLLLLKTSTANSDSAGALHREDMPSVDPLDQSLQESIHAVGRHNGLRVSFNNLSASTNGLGQHGSISNMWALSASINGLSQHGSTSNLRALSGSTNGLRATFNNLSNSTNGLNQKNSTSNLLNLLSIDLNRSSHATKPTIEHVQVLPSLMVRRKSLQLADISYHSTDEKSNNGRSRSPILDNDIMEDDKTPTLLPPLNILEAQTASTEIRGGQAGGISSLEYRVMDEVNGMSVNPRVTRVRCVARKRVPLSSDLAVLYRKQGGSTKPDITSSFIGHTRFATSSINRVPELHPHEWVPFHDEDVWIMNQVHGAFEKVRVKFGVHISHNGDFDALNCYSQMITVGDVGLWLERVLHTPNSCNGDSPKVAGCLDLFRVQGRWSASCRLAYIRSILKSTSDVCDGEQLSKTAQNSFPPQSYFEDLGRTFNAVWEEHIGNVIKVTPQMDAQSKFKYCIIRAGEKQLVKCLIDTISLLESWRKHELVGFVNAAVRGFLRADLYTSMSEFLSRAEGSFGLQAHCSIEPGVVVIASKGQPMSLSYDPKRPIVLFGSEAEAVAVPVDSKGAWQPQRIDLDSSGEVVRLGAARPLLEGSFLGRADNFTSNLPSTPAPKSPKSPSTRTPFTGLLENPEALGSARGGYLLSCGIEIRAYSLTRCVEANDSELIERSLTIACSPIPYDPKVDLIAEDLRVVPGVLSTIDSMWKNHQSIEFITGDALCRRLVQSMKRRLVENEDSTDLIIGGVEASLWVAEQWASDLRSIFPQLNIITVSANKLLGIGQMNPSNVLFSGSDTILERRITENTCVLLISQSGQTFPTLHATRRLAALATDRIWILTGCFHSKMELAIKEAYQAKGLKYGRTRVFNNYSGNRPSEPSSVAIVATMHTLTRLLLHLVAVTREMSASGRQIHDWDYKAALELLRRVIRIKVTTIRKKKDPNYVIPKISEEIPLANCIRMSVHENEKKRVVMNLTDACITDMNSIVSSCVVPNASSIVGYDLHGYPLPDNALSINRDLVKQGRAWGRHISEPWMAMVLAGAYIFICVGFNLPVFGLLADAVAAIMRSCGYEFNETISFNSRAPHYIHNSLYVSLIGIGVQIVDAIWYIFIGKIITWLLRLYSGAPLFARMGKRTLVIVDTPCNHQLLENFVSKLFALSYGFVSIDVHGASGFDHFVHRFTHRVTRGVMLAIGRPDGRLCCLAKSECAVFLSVKQAAFIQNTVYGVPGAGPDIVMIGHNPYKPHLSDCNSITLRSDTRGKFVDELLYERLFLAAKPFAHSIIKSLWRNRPKRFVARVVDIYGGIKPKASYGSQHIDPDVVSNKTALLEFYLNCKELLTKKRLDGDSVGQLIENSGDPAVRLAFSSRLDSASNTVQDRQMTVQHFYESRVASMERYIAFCVMFHAMGKSCSHPWLCTPWDLARSQSNLRVATTACPINAGEDSHDGGSPEVFQLGKRLAARLRGYSYYF